MALHSCSLSRAHNSLFLGQWVGSMCGGGAAEGHMSLGDNTASPA